MTGEKLSRISHAEGPWLVARGVTPPGEASNEEIKTSEIRKYYARQIESSEGAVAHAVSSAALEGIVLEEAWREKLREVSEGRLSPEEVLAEELRRYSGI